VPIVKHTDLVSGERVRRYLDWLKAQFGDEYSDLYKLDKFTLLTSGGANLLRNKRSLWGIVTQAYPEHSWLHFGFLGRSLEDFHSSRGKEAALRALRTLIKQIERISGIWDAPSGWERVTLAQLGPELRQVLEMLGGLRRVLAVVYPKHRWTNLSQSPTVAFDDSRVDRRELGVDFGSLLTPQASSSLAAHQSQLHAHVHSFLPHQSSATSTTSDTNSTIAKSVAVR